VTKAFKVGLVYAAGTATVAPIKFTSTSATLLTTPTAGSMEVDSSGNLYYSPSTTRYTVPLSTTGNSLIFTTSGATTITLPTSGTMITSSSPTITTPTIATINAGGIAATPFLYSDVTTGTVNVATGLTSGVLKLGNSISISGATGQTVATPTVGSGSSNGITIQSGNSPSMPGTVSINAGGDGTTVFGGTITLSGGTGYIGGATTIQAGSYAGLGTGGLLNLQAGGGSTHGAITIGTTYASSITIGKSGVSTTINGGTTNIQSIVQMSNGATGFFKFFNPASNSSQLQSLDTSTASTQSFNVYINSGNATGTTSNSGAVTIDAGTATGTAGTITIGGTNASGLTIGRSAVTTTINGTTSHSGAVFMTGGITYLYQPAITTISTTGASTLTIAQLLTEIVNYTGSNTATFTLPTGTLMDGGVSGIVNNVSFDWSIVNTVAFAITMSAGSSHTYVGNTTVAASVSARFRSVRTGTTTWVTYRLS